MDLIQMTRMLGKELQRDERYLAFQVAQQLCDEDEGLQNDIGEFNLKRMSLDHEAQKENRDETALQQMNLELRALYDKIMNQEKMLRLDEARGQLDAVLKEMKGLIDLFVQGEDPDTAVYAPADCAGNCSGCSGCGG